MRRGGREKRGLGAAAAALAFGWAWAGLALTAFPTRGAAQVIPPPAFVLTAGVFDRDYQGSGTERAFGARVRFPLGTYLLVEPGLVVSSFEDGELQPELDVDPDITLYVFDFQIQAQYPLGRFRPFLGIGAGGAFDPRENRGTDEFVVSTYSLAAGAAADLGRRFEALLEVRHRTLDDFDASGLHLFVGLGWHP